MAKTAFVVDRPKLEAAIKQAEAGISFTNRNALYLAVEPIYNGMSPPRQLTAAVVGLRVKEWKLECKTPFGKRGRSKGVAMSPEHKARFLAGRSGSKRKSRAEKNAAHPDAEKNSKHMRLALKVNGKEALLPIVERVEAGSLRAAVKLNCLQCVGYAPKEVKLCQDYACPWFLQRPYQKATDDELAGPLEVEEPVEDEAAEAA